MKCINYFSHYRDQRFGKGQLTNGGIYSGSCLNGCSLLWREVWGLWQQEGGVASVAAGGRCGVSVAAGGWSGGPHISTDEDTQRRDNGSHLASSFFFN